MGIQEELDLYKKKEKYTEFCKEHDIDVDDFLRTALKMEEADVERYMALYDRPERFNRLRDNIPIMYSIQT